MRAARATLNLDKIFSQAGLTRERWSIIVDYMSNDTAMNRSEAVRHVALMARCWQHGGDGLEYHPDRTDLALILVDELERKLWDDEQGERVMQW